MSFATKLITAIVEQAPQMLDAHEEDNPLPVATIEVDEVPFTVADDESYDGKLQLLIYDGVGRRCSLVLWY